MYIEDILDFDVNGIMINQLDSCQLEEDEVSESKYVTKRLKNSFENHQIHQDRSYLTLECDKITTTLYILTILKHSSRLCSTPMNM